MRRQPKFNTFTCFLLSKLSTSKLPFFKTSNPHFLISKLSFIHFKAQFHSFQNQFFPFQSSVSASWDLVFSFHPPVSSSPYLVFLISTPILLFLKPIFLISPPASFISNLNLSYLRLYFLITTVLNQSLRTPAYWSWESESRITTWSPFFSFGPRHIPS